MGYICQKNVTVYLITGPIKSAQKPCVKIVDAQFPRTETRCPRQPLLLLYAIFSYWFWNCLLKIMCLTNTTIISKSIHCMKNLSWYYFFFKNSFEWIVLNSFVHITVGGFGKKFVWCAPIRVHHFVEFVRYLAKSCMKFNVTRMETARKWNISIVPFVLLKLFKFSYL